LYASGKRDIPALQLPCRLGPWLADSRQSNRRCNGEFLIAKREAITFSSFGNLPEDAVIQVTLQYFPIFVRKQHKLPNFSQRTVTGITAV
jgi:hypothetical protein